MFVYCLIIGISVSPIIQKRGRPKGKEVTVVFLVKVSKTSGKEKFYSSKRWLAPSPMIVLTS